MLEGYRRKMQRYIKSITHKPVDSHFLTLASIDYKILHESEDLFSLFHLINELYHHAQDYESNRVPVVRRICLLVKNSFEQNAAYGSKIQKLVVFSTQSLLLWKQSLRNQLDSHNYGTFREADALLQHETAQYYYFCLSIYNKFINTDSIIMSSKPQHTAIFRKQSIKKYLLIIRKSIALVLQQTQHQNYYKIKLAIEFCIFNANWVKILRIGKNGKPCLKEIEFFYINALKSMILLVKLIQKFRHHQFSKNFQQLKQLIKYLSSLYHPFFEHSTSFCKQINKELQKMCEEKSQEKLKYSGEKKAVEMAQKFRCAWVILNNKRLNKKKQQREKEHQKLTRSVSKKRRSLLKRDCDIDQSQKFEINNLKKGKSKSLYLKSNSISVSPNQLTKIQINNCSCLIINPINPVKPQFINRLKNRVQSAKVLSHNTKTQKQPEQVVNLERYLKSESKVQFKPGINLQNKRRNLYLSIRR